MLESTTEIGVGVVLEWEKGRWAVVGSATVDHCRRMNKQVALSIRDGRCWIVDLERCAGVASASPEAELSRKLVAEQRAAFVPEQCRLRHLVRISRWSRLYHGLLGSLGIVGWTEAEVLFVYPSSRLWSVAASRLLR